MQEDLDLYVRDHEKNLFFSFFSKIYAPNLYARDAKIFIQLLDKEEKKNPYPNQDKRERRGPNNQSLAVGKKEGIDATKPHTSP